MRSKSVNPQKNSLGKKSSPKLVAVQEKVQKLLAELGLGSRRAMEKVIAEGRVSVNGQIIKLGDRASLEDKIRMDGHIVNLRKNISSTLKVLMYYKPEGEICTRDDPENRRTVFQSIPHLHTGRWVQIGRLDVNTSGLLLFTNDGGFANQLMHPKYEIEREYAARILGEVTPDILQRLQTGVMLDDGMAKFDQIKDAGGQGVNHWYHVILREGRQREVRRLWDSQGVKLNRLIRIRYGNLLLPPRLKKGQWEYLDEETIQDLKALTSEKGSSDVGR